MRTKIEMNLGLAGTPELEAGLYAEHHIKLLINKSELFQLEQLGAKHGAHVSRNAFKHLGSGLEERFLTQRFAPGSYALAREALSRLLASVELHGWSSRKVERELVLQDDNLVLDQGWCLQALAASPIREQVVVRGSTTLQRWFGESARRAKDIDLVVRVPSWRPNDTASNVLLATIRQIVLNELRARGVNVLEKEVTVDSIWTYERAEGRRILFPWQVSDRR